MTLTLSAIIIFIALVYGYVNGLTVSATVVATIISARALGPRTALLLAGFGTLLGPFLMGVAVANTLGAELISPLPEDPNLVIAALLGTTAWSLFAFGLRIPTSYSQTLVGSLIGATWVSLGRDAIVASGLTKTLAGLFLSPVLGLTGGYLLFKLIYLMSALASPAINHWFNRGQVLLAFLLALSFGANDGQKVMAIISLGLVTTGFSSTFVIPFWVILISAIAIGSGALIGGHQLIRMLGLRIYKIRPIEGFGAQFSASTVLLVASIIGAPVSGSQITTMSIVGAGSADRLRKIRWLTVRHILIGWLVTMPSAMALSAGFYKLIERGVS